MELLDILLLLSAGLAAGFIAGLIGVGGGIIFAPVLLFHFQHIGVPPHVVAQLTVGSSLLCTVVAALASAWFQFRRDAVSLRVALRVGIFSAIAIYFTTRFVTTKPWYDATTFQVVFSLVLLIVVARMVLSGRRPAQVPQADAPARQRWPFLAGTGTAAGAVAAATGVGGGVVFVPAYNTLLRLPIHRAVGTSSATIVLSSLFGVINYAAVGLGEPVPSTAVGYVDFGRALLLVTPAVLSARLGVWTAHRIKTQALRWSFAFMAAIVAFRLLLGAFS